jgi:mannopine transport system permease protein
MSALARKGRPTRRAGDAALGAAAYAVTIFLLLPTLVIVPMSVGPERYLQFPPSGFSLRWYGAYFADQDWINATLFSLEAGLISTVCATVIGTMLALALVRGTLPGKELIELMVIGPVIVPHIALAVAMFLVFEQLRLTGTLLGFAMAHTILALPFVVFTVLAALYRFDADLERAALSCGAGPVRTFRHVTLPLIAPGVISAALFAFIISFDEAVVSFFISNLDRKTLPRKMFEDIDYNISPTIAAVATMLTLLTIAALLGSHVVRSRMERRAASAESKPTAATITPKAT